MAVVYNQAVQVARMTDVLNAIDAGSGAGKIILYTAGDVEVATLTLNDPCGTVSNANPSVLTFDNDPVVSDASATGGVAAKATIVTSADAVVVSGLTVGVGTGNIQVNSTTIAAGATVSLTGTNAITHNTAG
jgi:hypothetical protein